MFLDYVESAGEHLTGQALHIIRKRGTVILRFLHLLLGTGIRVSECVGLDLTGCRF